MYSLETMWKLLDDGKLLNQGDQAHERMGWGPKMTWYNPPGPPVMPLDTYSSDGPWAFGPENEKGRFYIEHTGLNGKIGYVDSDSCKIDKTNQPTKGGWHPCVVMLHTDPDSAGYKHPLMFKKWVPDMGDCPSCSNGFFMLQTRNRAVPYFEGEFNPNYLALKPAGILVH